MTDPDTPRDELLPPEPDDAEPVVHPFVATRDDLPDELDRLGAQLERAARSSLRRRNKRGQFIQSLAIVLLAAPVAVAVSSSDLAPSDTTAVSVPSFGTAALTHLTAPSRAFSVGYIRDEPALATTGFVTTTCLDGRDCTAPAVQPDTTITALEGKL